MEKRIKTVNRKIRVSKKCRCKYNDATSFDVLQVNIAYNNIIETYQVEAKFLSKEKDSIYFYPSIVNNRLIIRWNKEIESYISKIK